MPSLRDGLRADSEYPRALVAQLVRPGRTLDSSQALESGQVIPEIGRCLFHAVKL